MKYIFIFVSLLLYYSVIFAQDPMNLHPENPHYFLYRGESTLLISSAEHYGMVLNTELNYKDYLDVLQEYGFNQTRVFSGVYCEGGARVTEPERQFNWENVQNTLSPRPLQFLTPWKRSREPGYINGGNKFDLNQWDEEYFKRLKTYCREAEKRNIIIEMVLFTANYRQRTWLNSPLNINNNINGVGDVPYNEFHLLKHEALIEHQLRMVRKIVSEVNEFDNIYFEICNEPYWLKGIPQVEESIKEQQFLPEINEWQQLISRCIVETEEQLPKKHLIAQNFANTYLKIQNLDNAVSAINFHYAFPPNSVTDNYQFDRPIAFDETSDGCNAPDRRKEAWAFVLAGGAVYSNLDWSFATDDLTGLGRNPSGRRISGKEVRDQLYILSSIIREFDFVHAKPINETFRHNIPEGINVYGLTVEGEDYIFYWLKNRKTDMKNWNCPLLEGTYELKFIDPIDGKIISRHTLHHPGEDLSIDLPFFPDDLILRITRANVEFQQ